MRYFVVPAVILGVLGLGGYLGGKPVYRAIRTRRGVAAAEQAAAHFATNDFEGGVKFLKLAASLAPNSAEVTQVRVDVLTKFRDPRAIDEWRQLNAIRPPSLEQQWRLVDFALDVERLDVAGEELGKLEALHARKPEYLRRATRYFLQSGRTQDAVETARSLAEVDSGNPKSELLLGEALIQSGDAAQRAEGRRALLLLAQTDATVQDAAISQLIDHSTLTSDERVMLSRLINARSDLDLNGHIISATLRMTSDRQQRENAAEEVRAHLPAGNEDAAVHFADWCLRYQAPTAAALGLQPFAKSTNSNTATLYVQAVALSENWTRLDELLSEPDSRMDASIVASIRGWRAAKAGKSDDAVNYFKIAISKAAPTKDNPQRYTVVASWAEIAKMPLMAVEAYAPLVAAPQTTVFAARASLKLLADQSTLAPSLPILRSLLDYAPNDGSIQTEYARTALVLNREVAKALPIATNLLAQYPKSSRIRVLAAAAETRNGNPAKGVALLEESPIDFTDLDDRWRALQVLVLAKGQLREPARRIIRQLKLDAIKAEEKTMVEESM